jgi:hypothetical protein
MHERNQFLKGINPLFTQREGLFLNIFCICIYVSKLFSCGIGGVKVTGC